MRSPRSWTKNSSQGESWILNDPFRGGTHLPDITLITPVFWGTELAGFVASRAHHADVGGPTPGSMPANSRSLEEEGVVIPPTRLADQSELSDITAGMRNRPQRVADLRAQLAANDLGARRLGDLIDADGLPELSAAMREILDYSERRTRARPREARGRRVGGARRARGRPRRVGGHRTAREGHDRRRGTATRLRRQRRAGGRATSTARSRSPARRRSSACECCSTPTHRPAPAPIARSRSRPPEGRY